MDASRNKHGTLSFENNLHMTNYEELPNDLLEEFDHVLDHQAIIEMGKNRDNSSSCHVNAVKKVGNSVCQMQF